MGATTMALITDVRNWVLCFVKLPCRFLLQKNRETSWSSWITFLLPDSFFISSFFLVRKILGSEGIISLNYQLRTRYVFLCVCVCVSVCVIFPSAFERLTAVSTSLRPKASRVSFRLMGELANHFIVASAKMSPPSSSPRECDRFCFQILESTLFQRISTPFTDLDRGLIWKWLLRFRGKRSIHTRSHANISVIDEV